MRVDKIMVPDVLFKAERDHSQTSECHLPALQASSSNFKASSSGFRASRSRQGLNQQVYGLGTLYNSPGMVARDSRDASQVPPSPLGLSVSGSSRSSHRP
jgi:hypothetical protein